MQANEVGLRSMDAFHTAHQMSCFSLLSLSKGCGRLIKESIYKNLAISYNIFDKKSQKHRCKSSTLFQ